MNNSIVWADWPNLPEQFSAAYTTRKGGVSLPPYDDGAGGGGLNLGDHVGDDLSHVRMNRHILRTFLPHDLAPLTWLQQVHGTNVIHLDNLPSSLVADASFTHTPRQACVVLTADCLPILLCDIANKKVAAVHAGWRGLLAGVLEHTLMTMQIAACSKKPHIIAWLGPAIGPEAFVVGREVYDSFVQKNSLAKKAFQPHQHTAERFDANIYQLARLFLKESGVVAISGGHHCTVTEKEQFYSYRRENITGRMATLIWINEPVR